MTAPNRSGDAGRRACRVWVRCYAELNDLLPPDRRHVEFPVDLDVGPSVKDLIEGVGVPHTEVDLVLVDGEPVDFSHPVRDGDRVSVYPVFESIDVGPVTRVRPEPLRETRFVLDTHLGRLARYLRLVGFDADYERERSDDELATTSRSEGRILLTCDRGLLKRSAVTHGYLVRERRPRAQLLEVVHRFDLGRRLTPFTRCLACNGLLRDATPSEVATRVPASVRWRYERYRTCPRCGRVYWQGSHHARLARIVDDVRRSAGRPDRPG
ncbi:MAG: Mut7-C ubiquitin/RNAse domain-containing protein [Acidimicrobiia bacterium]|nr:Mut7-C ubiquitin/RNAse domain-containing protein [Acidimicrobiia bacterium]